MRQFVSAACGLWLAFAGLAQAQTEGDPAVHPVVVELYTSQGCSSCPPADDFLAELASDPRVIALALHVDYWDYLGWRDAFARPEFTKRQKSYAKAVGSKMIYTPQMIVAGQEMEIGTHRDAVGQAILRQIEAGRTRGQVVRLTLERNGDQIVIRAEAVPPSNDGLRVQLVRYRPSEHVDISKGENAGRSLTYHNIVTAWQVVGTWQPTGPLTLTAPAPGDDRSVVILQADGPGRIVAAAELR